MNYYWIASFSLASHSLSTLVWIPQLIAVNNNMLGMWQQGRQKTWEERERGSRLLFGTHFSPQVAVVACETFSLKVKKASVTCNSWSNHFIPPLQSSAKLIPQMCIDNKLLQKNYKSYFWCTYKKTVVVGRSGHPFSCSLAVVITTLTNS